MAIYRKMTVTSIGRDARKASSMAGADGDGQEKVPMWSGLVSFSVVINTVTKATWRNYSSTSQSITEGSQGRNLEQSPGDTLHLVRLLTLEA